MLWRPTHHKRTAQLADGLTTAASFVIAYYVWDWFRTLLGVSRDFPVTPYDIWKIIIFSIVWIIILTRLNAYSYQLYTSFWQELKIVFKGVLVGVFVFFAAYFFFRYEYVPRSYIFVFGLLNFICLISEKFLLFWIAKLVRKKTKNRKRILVVGTGERSVNFVQNVEEKARWDVEIVGFLSKKVKEKGLKLIGKEIIGSFVDIVEILHKNIIDEVVICVPEKDFVAIKEVLEVCEREGVQVRLNSDFFGNLVKTVSIDNVYGMPIVSFYLIPQNELALFLKRLLDIFISSALLIILSPLLLVIAILTRLTSKGPIFFQWNVVGLNKKPFKSWKFRTMVPEADELKEELKAMNEMKGPVFKITNDPRVTKFGRFLRRFSLDELPQLWSVFKGDMSLVGPRPPLQYEIPDFESWQRRKLSMKPGLTCLWQIKGRSIIKNFDDWAKLDLEYIDNWSLTLDMKILFLTFISVFKGSGK